MGTNRNISSIEQKAINSIQEEEALAFFSLKNIHKRLSVLAEIVKHEKVDKTEADLLEKAVWIYNIAHYYNYKKPLDAAAVIIDNWIDKIEEEIKLRALLPSIFSDEKNTMIEKILHDSITSFWAEKKIEKQLLKLKADDSKHGLGVSDEEWINEKQKQINTHVFFTKTAQENYVDKKRTNVGVLEKMSKKLEKKKDILLQEEFHVDAKDLKELKKKLKKIEGRPERGVETIFRLASRNLYTRAKILDSKSSILITVNSIILSVVLGTLYSQIAEDPHLVIPVISLFITNLASVGFATIATRPELKNGLFSREDVTNKKASLLNFDDYHAVSIEDFEWAMDQVVNDADYLYHTITWDLHHMGKRMHFKYRNLKIAYNIFLYGLIISITLFMACHLFFDWT